MASSLIKVDLVSGRHLPSFVSLEFILIIMYCIYRYANKVFVVVVNVIVVVVIVVVGGGGG